MCTWGLLSTRLVSVVARLINEIVDLSQACTCNLLWLVKYSSLLWLMRLFSCIHFLFQGCLSTRNLLYLVVMFTWWIVMETFCGLTCKHVFYEIMTLTSYYLGVVEGTSLRGGLSDSARRVSSMVFVWCIAVISGAILGCFSQISMVRSFRFASSTIRLIWIFHASWYHLMEDCWRLGRVKLLLVAWQCLRSLTSKVPLVSYCLDRLDSWT